jgi:RHS repeat-associated protein
MRANQTKAVSIVTVFLFCVLFAPSVFAQNVQFTQGSVSSGLDSTIQIPIQIYPGRSGSGLPVTLYYSSRVWRIDNLTTLAYQSYYQSVAQAIYAEYSTAGWRTSLDLPRIEWPKITDTYYYSGGPECIPCGGLGGFRVRRVYIHMPDGSTHELRQDDLPRREPIKKTGTFYAVDGSRLRYDSTGDKTGTLYLPDGTRYVLNDSTAQFIDRNGNTLNYDAATRQWTDTVGRTVGVPLPADPATLPLNPDGSRSFTYKGKGIDDTDRNYTLIWKNLGDALTDNSPTNSLRVVGSEYLPIPTATPNPSDNVPHSNGQPSLFFAESPDTGEGGSDTPVVGEIGENGKWAAQGRLFNPIVLAEIQLPNGLSYKFSYNIYGEIDKVTYPTGAYDTYSYTRLPSVGDSVAPYTQANRGVTQRQQSAKGDGSNLATWTYSSTGTIITTATPDGIVTESYRHNFPAPLHGNRTPRPLWAFGFQDARNGMIYDERTKASATGPILRRKLVEWGQSVNNVPPRIDPQLAGDTTEKAYRNPRPSKEVNLILDTGGQALAKTTSYSYDSTYQFTTGLDLTASSESYFAEVDPTIAQSGGIDLTSSNPTITIQQGTWARTVETAYENSPGYHDWNILGLPTSSIIKDGNGNIVSKVETSYDDADYAPLTYAGYSGSDYTPLDSTAKRGMATTIRRYVDPIANVYLERHAQFDQFGNLRIATNERGQQTLTDYLATYNYAFATQVTTGAPDPTPADPQNPHGSNAGFTSSTTYDKPTGLILTTTDANQRTTTFSYRDRLNNLDPLNRLRKIERPDGGWTRYDFKDELGDLYTSTEIQQDDSHTVKTYQYFDAMGRASRSFISEGSQNNVVNYIVSDTKYDKLGRTCGSSNPYRTQTLNGVVTSAGECSAASNWTTTTYDALGRVKQVTLSDGTIVQTSYEGIYTTTTDQSGKQSRQQVDALGRIARVDEQDLTGNLGPVNAPKQPTSYEYDALGNLVHIAQNYDLVNGVSGTYAGVQHRYFKYDSLSRLIYERHVEQEAVFSTTEPAGRNNQWTRQLVYDENGYAGLLTSQYDARKIHTQYTYDNLNRVTGVTYTKDPQTPAGYAETPAVSYFYDNTQFSHPNETRQVYNLGRLTKVKTESLGQLPETTQAYNYDSMGYVANNRQMVGTSNPYYMLYKYNVGGALKSEQYPSGRVTTYDYDDAGRLAGLTSGSSVSAGQFKYEDPRGLLSSFALGNGTNQSYTYNSRLQVQSIELSKGSSIIQRYEFKYGEVQSDRSVNQAKNNGQIGQIESFVSGQKVWQQQFQYDSLGRLSTASERQGNNDQLSYQINYDYDQFGNRYLKEASNPVSANPLPHTTIEANDIDKSTNHFTSNLDSGVTYDKAGNVLVDSRFTLQSYLYDANNRQQQVAPLGGPVGGAPTSSAMSSTSDTGTSDSIIVNNGAPPTISVYDGLGQRVAQMSNGNINQVMVYDAVGKLVAEYGKAPVYMETMMADLSGTHYVLTDHQGSTRVVTDTQGVVIARHDYEPFGREIYSNIGLRGNQGYGAGDGVRQKFAGMESEESSTNNHTLWRKYDSFSGRWLSPDPYSGSMSTDDPQSFNRYSYVNNDPVNLTDPSGLMPNTGADVGWSGFEGWGGGFDFNAPHFGGPQIIENGMNGFPDRVTEEEEDVTPPSVDVLGGSVDTSTGEFDPGTGQQQDNRPAIADMVSPNEGVGTLPGGGYRFGVGLNGRVGGDAGHDGDHVLGGRNGSRISAIAGLTGTVLTWYIQEQSKAGTMYSVYILLGDKKTVLVLKDIENLSSKIRQAPVTTKSNPNFLDKNGRPISKVTLKAGDYIGTTRKWSGTTNSAQVGLHFTFVNFQSIKQYRKDISAGNGSPASFFIAPCGSSSPVRCR